MEQQTIDTNVTHDNHFARHARTTFAEREVPKRAPTNRIVVQPRSIGQGGQQYRVLYQECVLVARTTDPLFDACRALASAGVRGRLEMWHHGKTFPAQSIDIAKGARLTVVETPAVGPVIRAWKPFSAVASKPAFAAKTSEAGRASRVSPRVRHPRKFHAPTTQPLG